MKNWAGDQAAVSERGSVYDDVWIAAVLGRKWAKRRLCRSQSGACAGGDGDPKQAKHLLIEQPKKTLPTGEPTMRA
jgi:hypothetical protein